MIATRLIRQRHSPIVAETLRNLVIFFELLNQYSFFAG